MFHDLKIADLRRETEDSVVLTFDVPETLRETFAFTPGQYLTLRAEVDGQDARRSYSIASAPGAPLCVGVKTVEGGLFSPFCQTLEKGAVLKVMAPEGRFTLGDERNLLLVAAGSGITPMMAIAAQALARGGSVTLVYGNRDSGSIMFREALEQLKDRYMERFTLIHVLSREPQDVDLLHGRIDGDRVLRLAKAGAIELEDTDGVFLCGPGGMIDDVAEKLEGAGVPRARIHFERFFQEGEGPRPTRSEKAAEAAEQGVSVEVVLDGARRAFGMGAEDDTVLEAAERQGMELPYSCRNGMCCTCRCRVAEGEAEMAVNYSLEPWELEAGFVLACQTRPTSSKLVLDFDAA